jgi:hypothetical protein
VTYQSEVLADNPLLYLRFSETAGASCADTSTSGFTGTAHGTFTRNVDTGLSGWGIGISLGGGATDYISVPDNPALDLGGSMTYELVIKPTSFPAPVSVLMTKGSDGAANGGYSLQLSSGGVPQLTNAFWGGVYASGSALTANTEYHIAVTRAGDAGIVYTNAVAGATTHLSAQAFTASGQPFTIGQMSSGGSLLFPYPGLVDEVAVYGTTLSAARIEAHYAARGGVAGNPVKSPPGAFVAAIAQARNVERKADHGQGRPPDTGRPPGRRSRLDYLHKRGRPA